MVNMKSKKYYAYVILGTKTKGVANTWDECKVIVSGAANAKFKGFTTKEEAERWLEAGADYGIKHIAGKQGIYFDAGTGGGHGVEISVTNEKGNNLLDKVLPPSHINKRGKHWIVGDVTNNYGELLACKYALQIASKAEVKNVFGDSKLVLEFWSKGFIKKEGIHPKTIELAQEVARLRKEFEKLGGSMEYISGAENPADLGFHK
jgi:ribonuclease HI